MNPRQLEERLIRDIVIVCAEDEVAMIGMSGTESLVRDTLSNRNAVLKTLATPEEGHSMHLYEAIMAMFTVIQGIDSVLSVIERLKKKGVTFDVLLVSAEETLRQFLSLSDAKWDQIRQLIREWLLKK